MIKSELIARLAATLTQLPEKKVAQATNHILQLMSDALINGRRIEVRGFGSFCLHHRPARHARNPKTGEQVLTDEKNTPYFKPGKELRERVNKAKNRFPIQKEL